MSDPGGAGQTFTKHASYWLQVQLGRRSGENAPVFQCLRGNHNYNEKLTDISFHLLQAAFDHSYSVGILRVRSGLDFSGQINAVETLSEDVDGESDKVLSSQNSNYMTQSLSLSLVSLFSVLRVSTLLETSLRYNRLMYLCSTVCVWLALTKGLSV